MPETSVSADFLSDLIEGRASSFGQPSPEADLARLAAACREISVPGPTPAVAGRLLERFETLLTGPRWQWWQGWAGPAPRPLVQRMAAGVVLLVASGGGASAAAGVPPHELAADAAGFVRSVVVNLSPRNGEGGSPPVTSTPSSGPTAAVSPTITQAPPAATGTPAQGGLPTAEPDPEPAGDDDTRTPEPGDDDDNSGPGSDNSGSGSNNSGSGSQNSGSSSSGGDD